MVYDHQSKSSSWTPTPRKSSFFPSSHIQTKTEATKGSELVGKLPSKAQRDKIRRSLFGDIPQMTGAKVETASQEAKAVENPTQVSEEADSGEIQGKAETGLSQSQGYGMPSREVRNKIRRSLFGNLEQTPVQKQEEGTSPPTIPPSPPLKGGKGVREGSQVEAGGEEKGLAETEITLPIQAKLTIGEPNDKYEQEADRVARQVVDKIHSPTPETVQREEMGDEDEVRLKSDAGSGGKLEAGVGVTGVRNSPIEGVRVNRKVNSEGETSEASAQLEASIQGKRGSGQPLDESVKEPMEREFGADFSGVRVHTDTTIPTPKVHQENKTGLPDNLKAGVENLSGISMDDVRVHYNSSKPTQLQALAYTQGTEIHVASGQEKHLPHEAWHVIQQAQGRVQPTMQLKDGVEVNDDQGLEHEADVMGQRALQALHTTKPVRQVLAPHRGMQRKVMQLIATQITMNKDRILQVIVRGRPERVFSNSMGDHTTAFIVQQEGLNIALQEKTIPEAIGVMEKLLQTLDKLPGFKFMGIGEDRNSASTTIGKRFLQELKTLDNSLTSAKSSDDQNIKIHHLQIAVNAYLSARELIPFSTINVGEKSKGKAGRGHGESGPAAVLSEYERSTENSKDFSDDDLTNAVYKLFDYQSAGMLSSTKEQDMISRMTAGISLDSTLKPEDRLNLIWEQHKLSIATMFPKVFAKIQDKLTSDNIVNVIKNLEEEEFNDRARRVQCILEQALISYTNIKNPKVISFKSGSRLNWTKVSSIIAIYQLEAEALSLIEQMREINQSNEERFLAGLQNSEMVVKKYLNETECLRINQSEIDTEKINNNLNWQTRGALTNKFESSQPIDSEQTEFQEANLKNIRNIKAFAKGSVLKDFAAQNYDVKHTFDLDSTSTAPKQSSSKPKKTQATTLVRDLLPMAIQVALNEKGEVSKMISSGRPNSPFSHSMGAHSTAWAVHLDRVERRILGKTLQDAIEEMKKLGKEVLDFAKNRKHMTMGDKAKNLHPTAQESLHNFLKKDTINIVYLQDLINAILSFYNLIPGVSRDKIDTGGKGEGTYRRRLLNYEKYGVGSKPGMRKEELIKELDEAIKGMYDSPARSGALWDNHLTVISQAYPDAYELVHKNAEPKMEQDIPEKEKPSSDDEDENEDIYHPLDSSEISKLKKFSQDTNWLLGINNCLINAITDAAGIQRATADQVVKIRTQIGAAAGEMLFASPRVLNIILAEFGLQDIGVIVINMGSEYLDMSSTIGDNPLYIYHDGINHFEALPRIINDNSVSLGKKKRGHSSLPTEETQDIPEEGSGQMDETIDIPLEGSGSTKRVKTE